MRIAIGGGGTDLPAFYRKHGGWLWAATIDRFVVVDGVSGDFLTQMPPGAGLGGSGAYKVGLLKAQHPTWSKRKVARKVEELGKQDQYLASFGGFRKLIIGKDGSVRVFKLTFPDGIKEKLNRNLMLFFTGETHSSAKNLKVQEQRVSKGGDPEQAMLAIRDLGKRMLYLAKKGDLRHFGKLMNHHWDIKKTVAGHMSNKRLDAIYDKALKAGAHGGKIVGSGGGGCFLFWVPKGHDVFATKMEKLGLTHINYKFHKGGSRII